MSDTAGNKVVLVTGASAGIGYCAVEKLLGEGYTVYAAARRVEKMKDLEEQGAHLIRMDVRDDAAVEAGVSQLIEEQGRIDVLVNNAGYGSYGTIEDIPIEEIRNQFDVNVFGYARLQKAVLPHMRRQGSGRIINVASVVSFVATPVLGWYAATKHAIKGMSDALRMEVKALGIDVVMIEPGALKTEFDVVAFAALDKVEISKEYKELVAKVVDYMKDSYAKCEGPENTAKFIVEAVKAKHPNTQYRTTTDAKMFIALKALLGDKMFDYMIGQSLK